MGKLSYGERAGKADEVPGKGVGWNSEPRWWENVRARIEHDQSKGKQGLSFDAFLKAGEREMTDQQREQMEVSSRRVFFPSELLADAFRDAPFPQLFIPTTLEALVKGWRESPFPSRAPAPDPFASQSPLYPSTPFVSQRPSSNPQAEAAYLNSDDFSFAATDLELDEPRVAAAAAKAQALEHRHLSGRDEQELERRRKARDKELYGEGDDEVVEELWEGDGGFEEFKQVRLSQSQSQRGKGVASQRWSAFDEET